MHILTQTFQVPYQYNVYFTKELFSKENQLLADFFKKEQRENYLGKALIVIDEGFLAFHPRLPAAIQAYFQSLQEIVTLIPEWVIVPGGERVKNDPAYWEEVVEAVDRFAIDRHSYLIAIGGGAVLDMAGYAAAVSHRGVRHIRIPTTVLSQNDSGVGVKNSVNYKGKKNFLGTFVPPVAVINDGDFLTTLDDRDWRSGISEALKVALIKDVAFFEWIEAHAQRLAERDPEAMAYLVPRCADMHLHHIRSGDPFEFGSSRPLDFGHWAAHKLEYLTQFEIRHGEAVAIGIALDSIYSMKKGLIAEADVKRILQVFHVLGFELFHPKLAEQNKINLITGLQEFREHLGGRLTIMLLEALGKGVEVHEMDDDLIRESVDYLKTAQVATYEL